VGDTRGLDLFLDLRRGKGLGRSLEAALREAVRSGRLAPGTRLPGSRSLAGDLGLSRGTVVQVFDQLIAEGWLVGVAGSGTVVSDVPAVSTPREPERRAAPALPSTAIDLRPGRPDPSSFPRGAWAGAVRRVLAGSTARLDYGSRRASRRCARRSGSSGIGRCCRPPG
jgi:GntR family transcriptional regulator / MocR family aminotransferase